MSIEGTPKICPKPYPSVSFDLNLVEISNLSQLYVNETITHNEQIQPVELKSQLYVCNNRELSCFEELKTCVLTLPNLPLSSPDTHSEETRNITKTPYLTILLFIKILTKLDL